MTLYAISATYSPEPKDGWESGGVQLPTFYLHPNVQMILSEAGAKAVALDIFRPMLEQMGGKVSIDATKVVV